MNLEEQIYTRKSCRNYRDDEFDMSFVYEFMSKVKPLHDNIDFRYEILLKEEVKLKTKWSAPYYLAIYSEANKGYKENVGFVFQQLSLCMQSKGIGSCWVGMGTVKDDRPDFVILMAFGKSDDMTRERNMFKRKDLSKISDFEDEKLIPAQLAPSAINSQPWYFRHTDDGFDVFKVKQNLFKRRLVGKWNSIDVGISLAHLYVANPDTFEFNRNSKVKNSKGHAYVGSIKI